MKTRKPPKSAIKPQSLDTETENIQKGLAAAALEAQRLAKFYGTKLVTFKAKPVRAKKKATKK